MASWEIEHWLPDDTPGTGPRARRAGGGFSRYVPDLLDGRALAIDGDLARRIAAVERDVRRLNSPGADGLAGIARFLLRSESIASSQIEGITPSARNVALAELGQHESVRGVSEQARLVANNMTAVRRSTTELVEAEEVTVEQIVAVHESLLPDQPHHHGLRTVQNWIGRSHLSPVGAEYVPPAPEAVPALMHDLVDYLNGAAHAPLVQAALVHAQFETIHPFTDGNGRVGRALVHTVLVRRGLTPYAVLPISLVLATLRDAYVSELTEYRHEHAADDPRSSLAICRWVEMFVAAAGTAAEQAAVLNQQIDELRQDWADRLARHRSDAGRRPAPRADSAVARLSKELTEAPVTTATTLARMFGISFPAASAALEEMRAAGLVRTVTIERGATAFVAHEVLDLVTTAERRLASTQFDTRAARPSRPAPARPSD